MPRSSGRSSDAGRLTRLAALALFDDVERARGRASPVSTARPGRGAGRDVSGSATRGPETSRPSPRSTSSGRRASSRRGSGAALTDDDGGPARAARHWPTACSAAPTRPPPACGRGPRPSSPVRPWRPACSRLWERRTLDLQGCSMRGPAHLPAHLPGRRGARRPHRPRLVGPEPGLPPPSLRAGAHRGRAATAGSRWWGS